MIYSFELILSFISYTKLFDLILSCMIRLICTCPALICTCPAWSAWSAWSVLLELLLPFEASWHEIWKRTYFLNDQNCSKNRKRSCYLNPIQFHGKMIPTDQFAKQKRVVFKDRFKTLGTFKDHFFRFLWAEMQRTYVH